ncbi:CRTAC1 family protein [Sphaerisporangium sp. TRM90804]|uniref:CRTAC1 family protein n=1 Tax=Sphaerisporangium sp. TRM90804 TaxID=3031113 RepID=UPI002448A8DD|nr:CRTAC1 family protein [Sphaerisporangium sp. TRM90804]MDH2428365.1 CRTAC1 family protein [Sphaerisporangium sp. TRM90804]
MTATLGWLRRQLAGIVALVLVTSVFLIARLPTYSEAETAGVASKYSFQPLSVSLPSGYKQQTIREVNQWYKHIDAWISSVGAAIAMNDLDGDGLSNDLCIVDTRIDQAVVTPTPGVGATRYAPFALNPGALPMNSAMAPMGCVPGDFNEDGRLDLLVYLWGRTPIVYLAKTGATKLTADSYQAVELVPGANSTNGKYTGPQWNSNVATVADFDGDGHDDIFIGNYFADGPVLDPNIAGGVHMNHSMSAAQNGGENYFFRFTGATAGDQPTVTYKCFENVLPKYASKGWELGAGANDLDGDLLPELYLANDFGADRMFYNRSTPGNIKLSPVEGVSSPLIPKSKVVGKDSFKGMGVDFGDLNHDGIYDMFVSNITTSWGIVESNFQFMSTVKTQEELRAKLREGVGPWKDESAPAGTAWSGWGWDIKIEDFNNSGELAIAQATGFVKGQIDRWPNLQELATANDGMLQNPFWWPNATAGDDIGGHQTMKFFVKGPEGRYVDIAHELGIAIPVPTRGIATGDADGDGRLDFAMARQWDEPVFYQNTSPATGSFLNLKLIRDGETAGTLPAAGSPVTGAQVTVTTPDGRKFINRVDGSSGHSGRRSSEVHIGLGDKVTGPVQVRICWRDRTGKIHDETLQLTPGRHTLTLGQQAKEK